MTAPDIENRQMGAPTPIAPPSLGVVADDITGATDVASALTDAGLRVTLIFGVPTSQTQIDPCDAVVVALKTRTLPVHRAVEQSMASLRWLDATGLTRFFIKYCSTFDSTREGNIGPVADAAMELIGTGHVLHAPSYPANGRTVYQGHLFVGHQLLSESGMEHHPLTPMTDPNLVRFLAHQTASPVALLSLDTIRRRGATSALQELVLASPTATGTHVIADSISDDDLDAVATAAVAQQSPLLAGGAAFAAAWAGALGVDTVSAPPLDTGIDAAPAAVLVGSASVATRHQVAAFEVNHPTRRLTVDELEDPAGLAADLVEWGVRRMVDRPVLIAADTSPAGIEAARQRFGQDSASARIEHVLGLTAVGLVAAGLRRLVVAGGETSGAVAEALELRSVRVGRTICPGVPWTRSATPDVAIAFKSGNFGGDDFFADALQPLGGTDSEEAL